MLFKALRFIISLFLIPLCVAVTISFYHGIISLRSISESGLLFILGALTYSVVHLLLFKLDFLYVLAHEVTHALFTFFSGGKVMGIKISTKEGSVKTTSPNFFVILAPYFIPGYTVLLALLYFLLSFFMRLDKYSGLFIFLIGFSVMFHLTYTAQSMKEKQSDLVKAGYLFSIFFIYIVNLMIVYAIVSFFFREASFLNFLAVFYEKSREFYYSFWRQMFL